MFVLEGNIARSWTSFTKVGMNTEIWRLEHCHTEQDSCNFIVGLFIFFVKQVCALSLVLTPLPPTISLLRAIICLLAALLRIPGRIRA